MRIWSKRAFRFDDPNREQPPVNVRSQAFATVPDWVVGLPFFRLAAKDGSITIINSAEEAVKTEHAAADEENAQSSRRRRGVKAGSDKENGGNDAPPPDASAQTAQADTKAGE